MARNRVDVAVVGGAGHVGLPLAVTLATAGRRVLAYDISKKALAHIARGSFPFMEEGGDALLRRALKAGRLTLSSDRADLAGVPTLIVTVGTPVDEFQNPSLRDVMACLEELLPVITSRQTLILRSTIFPGATAWIARYLASKGKRPHVAYCPERVVQGRAIEEIRRLPQIVSGMTPRAEARAAAVFRGVCPELISLPPMEAEFAKLFTNTYRYLHFAISNQFYTLAGSAGLDYHRIREAMMRHYPRIGDLPRPGLTAGPCLYKDTLQLVAFSGNSFKLGYEAVQVNEGLPFLVVNDMARRWDLTKLRVGVLGMAFKADSDDARSSLSYKLKKLLSFRAKEVLTTDPYVTGDPDLRPLAEVLRRADVLVLGSPHKAYRKLNLRGKPLVDIWNTRPGRPASRRPR